MLPTRHITQGIVIRRYAVENLLRLRLCDAIIYHMRKAGVRDLRYRFAEIEDLLRAGEEIQITKHRRVIGTLVPVESSSPSALPDFLARLKQTYGKKVLRVSGAELLARERDRH